MKKLLLVLLILTNFTVISQDNNVKEILNYSFGDYITKKLELNIQMDSYAKEGRSWYETH